MTKKRKLSPQEANRLAVHMQVVRIKLIQHALKYSFNGQSTLWGQPVDESTLEREKAILTDLYRIKTIYETAIYHRLPYLPSNGSRVEKIKEHYETQSGTIAFVEVKQSSHGASVVNHMMSKKTIKRAIKKKQQSSKRKTKQHGNKKEGGTIKTTSSRR